MIEPRPADQQGETRFRGVTSRHHFCYGPYQSPDRINWGRLRAFNRLEVAPGGERGPNFLGAMEVLLLAETGAALVQCGGERILARPGEIVHLRMRGGDDFGLGNRGSQVAGLTELWLTSDEWSGPSQMSRQRWHHTEGLIASSSVEDAPAILLRTGASLRFVQSEAAGRFCSVPLGSRHAYVCAMAGNILACDVELGANDALALADEPRADLTMRAGATCLVLEC